MFSWCWSVCLGACWVPSFGQLRLMCPWRLQRKHLPSAWAFWILGFGLVLIWLTSATSTSMAFGSCCLWLWWWGFFGGRLNPCLHTTCFCALVICLYPIACGRLLIIRYLHCSFCAAVTHSSKVEGVSSHLRMTCHSLLGSPFWKMSIVPSASRLYPAFLASCLNVAT